jgi:hypothetical protein
MRNSIALSGLVLLVAAVVVVSATAAESEAETNARRARIEALQQAEKLLASRAAVMPEMRAISVEGSIDGPRGPRVLINNQWVGVNAKVNVRIVRSQKALKAIEALREYDTAAADELVRRLDEYIAKNPQLTLTLQRIQPNALVFASPDGPQTVPFQVPSADGK